MAKKKPGRGGKGSRRGRGPEPAPLLPDWPEVQELLRRLAGPSPDSPEGRAEVLLRQAAHDPDPRRREALARQALEACPDCADAYLQLAADAPDRQAELALCQQAVAAGERAAGERAFQEGVGHFWGLLETRPYMRARQELAYVLWRVGRREEAVGHLQEMLRLNPNDNQGLRHVLADWFLLLDRDDDLAALIEQYAEDGTAAWLYTRALAAFRRHGDTPETCQQLRVATKRNKHVLDYLLGKELLPPEMPDSYVLGDSSAAVCYAWGGLATWKETPGAIDWLREQTQAGRKKRQTEQRAQGPLPLVQARLRGLPQGPDTWQVDCRQLATFIQVSGTPVRPWIALVVNASRGLILAQQLGEERPTPDFVYDCLAEAMQRPLAGSRGRPAEVQFRAGAGLDALRPPLEELGIHCTASDDLELIDEIAVDLSQHLAGDQEPGLLEISGVTPQRAARFYEAAARFYEQAPWRRLGYESPIEIVCDRFRGGPWYAIVMGASGMTMGLTLYEDRKLLLRLLAGQLSEEQNARLTVATTVLFGEAHEIPALDLAAAERFGWKVARPDAFPHAFRKERGMSTRPPTASELELLEACLRTTPDFVKRRRQDDSTPETFTVPAGEGEATLRLSWITSP
jgi:tetratricopeptide (TPR) repeat protein